jgi:hypothetical protein
MVRNEILYDPHHLAVPSGTFKMISEPMVRSAQTVQLSCDKISTISKRTKTSFHLSLVNLEYHRVHPKWFLTLWYVWRKLCTNLALTLKPSWNGPKRDSTWATSPRSSIGFFQNDFPSLWYIWSKSCTYLALILHCFQTDRKKIHVTSEFHRERPKQLPSLWYIRRKQCTYLASRLALSPNRLKWGSTCTSSPRSTIRCVQNDYWSYGMFGANHAPILHRH